jgi:hypothetical protein
MNLTLLKLYGRVWRRTSPLRWRVASFAHALFSHDPGELLRALGIRQSTPIQHKPIMDVPRDFYTVEIPTALIHARSQALSQQLFTHRDKSLEATRKSFERAMEKNPVKPTVLTEEEMKSLEEAASGFDLDLQDLCPPEPKSEEEGGLKMADLEALWPSAPAL